MWTKLPCLTLLCWLSPALAAPAPAGEDNPPAPGFRAAASDPRAVAVADATLRKMGGRRAWDAARILTWRFFGKRLHVWDKATGDIRVEYDEGGTHHVVLMNLNTRQGRAWQAGAELSGAPLQAALKDGWEAWVNDSYWLVMPYKLKDPGVALRYRGEAAMADGRPADVLELTFEGVGVTPENKYDVYVARDTGLVEQWSYYERRSDDKPRFTNPWLGWRRYGEIMLSADRGKGRGHTDVAVLQAVPPAVFQRPDPIDLRTAH